MNFNTAHTHRVSAHESTAKAAAKAARQSAPLIEPMEGRLLMSATTTLGVRLPSQPSADDRPTEEVAFYYNKIAFNY